MIKAKAILVFITVLLVSCDILKHKETTAQVKREVAKSDSGRVVNNSATDEKSKEFERTTYIYPQRDTTVTNNYIYPSTVIHEKGIEHEQSNRFNNDSFFYSRYDSLLQAVKQTEKAKEVKSFSFWQIAAIAGGICLLFLTLSKLGGRIKIV